MLSSTKSNAQKPANHKDHLDGILRGRHGDVIGPSDLLVCCDKNDNSEVAKVALRQHMIQQLIMTRFRKSFMIQESCYFDAAGCRGKGFGAAW
jgi:hypothetical protein